MMAVYGNLMADLAPYLGLWVFVILMVSTPGPANMLLMSAGAAYGFRANIPFMAGLLGGKIIVNLLIAFGMGAVLVAVPVAKIAFSTISAGYLCYLALRGWNAGKKGAPPIAPMGFVSGLVVHPLSPKAWVMASLAYSQFIVGFDSMFERYALAPLSFLAVQLVFHALWCWLGAAFQRQLGASPLLNRSLIIITIAVVVWALAH